MTRPPYLIKLLLGLDLVFGSRSAVAADGWTTREGFAIPRPGTTFNFPRDHGSHPAFGIEWWYVTGHLFETNGARYGFQATFFRRSAPRRESSTGPVNPDFKLDQLHLAHTALLDVAGQKFISQERLNREGWDAGAALDHLDVRNGNWSLRASEDASGAMQLKGSVHADALFDLRLVPQKSLVVFGTNGVSRKAAEVSAASHYLTYTRLTVEGSLRLGTRIAQVSGLAWMDHEFSSSQLGANQVGWDWACVQLRDGREIMAYRMRRTDGSIDPFSTLAWIDGHGVVQHVRADGYGWQPEGTWHSAATGANYPATIRLTTTDPATGKPIIFRIKPLAPDQELDGGLGGIPYWEGACKVLDETGREVGQSFLELTGYAGSMKGRL